MLKRKRLDYLDCGTLTQAYGRSPDTREARSKWVLLPDYMLSNADIAISWFGHLLIRVRGHTGKLVISLAACATVATNPLVVIVSVRFRAKAEDNRPNPLFG
jgi:hypothetical protein